jgi:hypothetical protein
MNLSRRLHLIVLALAPYETGTHHALFRFMENSSGGVAGNVSPTVHTGRSHLVRWLKKLPHKTA